MKRVLIIAEDRVVIDYCRQCLESAGAEVDSAPDLEAALSSLKEKKADAVLIGSVRDEPGEVVSRLKKEHDGDLQVLLLFASPTDLVRSAREAGATVPGSSNREAIFSQLKQELGVDELKAPDDEAWLSRVHESVPESVSLMQRAVHSLAKNPEDTNSARELFYHVHWLNERTTLVGLGPATRFISALEGLVYDLYCGGDKANASMLRTLSQSVDFIATLLEEKSIAKIKDPSEAKVLAVDDEADARDMVVAALEVVGIKAAAAENAKAALDMLEKEKFHLIFLDISMPHMSGLDACAEIRKLDGYQKTPVVFVTAMSTLEHRAQSTLRGGNDFIGKPFNVRELGVKALSWLYRSQLE